MATKNEIYLFGVLNLIVVMKYILHIRQRFIVQYTTIVYICKKNNLLKSDLYFIVN